MKTMRRFLLVLCVSISGTQMQAQEMPFNNGEELIFSVNYKYGLLNVKGGSGIYRTGISTYKGKSAIKTSLTFKTTSFIDKVVMNMRDTLMSYTYLPNLAPAYLYRSVYEGDYHYLEETFTRAHSDFHTEALMRKTYSNGEIKDTLLNASNAGYDFLNLFVFIRTASSSMKKGDALKMSALISNKIVAMTVHYAGKTTVNHNSADWFKVDVVDSKTFTSTTNAIEIWVSDDDNHVLLKAQAKLKIGAAVATLTSYKNLKDGSKSYQ